MRDTVRYLLSRAEDAEREAVYQDQVAENCRAQLADAEGNAAKARSVAAEYREAAEVLNAPAAEEFRAEQEAARNDIINKQWGLPT